MKSKRKISFLSISLLLLISCVQQEKKISLPIYGAKKLVNGDTVYHQIQAFNLLNQNGAEVSDKTTKDRIYVANFFFATCQSICPKMSSNLIQIQKEFIKNDSVLILSHSVNPLHDTVEVLKQYAGMYGAANNKWHLLTGNKKQIYSLAKTSYLVNALEDDGSAEGFLHSELFLLIDTKSRLRGMYDGTDSLAVNKLINDIKILLDEK